NRAELMGVWKVVSVQEGGAARQAGVSRVVVADKTLTFQSADGGEDKVYRFRLNPAEEPGEIDVACGGTPPPAGGYKPGRAAGPGGVLTGLARGKAGRRLAVAAARDSGATLGTLGRAAGGPAPAASPRD